MSYSINEQAGEVLGYRAGAKGASIDGIIFDQPCELNYHCPVCVYEGFDERLEWSEYNTMIWCRICDKDYPSAFCYLYDMDKAIGAYIAAIGALKAEAQQ